MFSKKTTKNSSKNAPITNHLTTNFMKNLFAREMGLITANSFINYSNTKRLDEIRLSKNRSIPSLNHSVTWLSLDNVEHRFLLGAKCDGNFACVDLFQHQTEKKQIFKFVFDSSKMHNMSSTHDHCISCLQWYPIDSGMFFTSGMDQKLKVWDTNALQVVDEYNLRHKIYNHHISLLMSSNCSTIVALALDNGQVRLVDINSGSYTHTLKAHLNGYCVGVQWSPIDQNILVSGGSDGRISLWDIRSSKSCLLNFDYEKTTNINDKKIVKSSSFSGTKSIAHHGSILGLTYTNDGNHILSLGKDNHLQLWNVINGTNTVTNYGKVPSNLASVETCLQLSVTEQCLQQYVLVPSNNNLLMYNIFDGTLKQTYKGHFESINCCSYNPILNEIYTGSKDRNILLWSVEKQETFSIKPMNSFSSNNNPFLNTNNKRPRDNWSDEDD